MAWPKHRIRTAARVSLPEMLVVGVIGTILISMVTIGIRKGLQSSRTATCMGNMHQIDQALLLYQNDFDAFPTLAPNKSLQNALSPWLANKPQIFHCPEDANSSVDSYSYFYAPRSVTTDADNYILGCSRHQNSTRGIVLLTGDATVGSPAAPVLHDSIPTTVGAEFDYGIFRFADGSEVSISMGQSSHVGPTEADPNTMINNSSSASSDSSPRPVISALFSSRRSNGTYYTVVKMKEGHEGTATFNIVPGNRFDVVTPTAVIAVRGTQFSITTLHTKGKPATRVQVSTGTVDVEPLSRGVAIRMTGAAGNNKAIVVQGQNPKYE